MPESGRKVFATHTARISKTVEAPLSYVYAWCTDYREDDDRLARSKVRFQILQIAKDRIVRIRDGGIRGGRRRVDVEMIRLKPPNAWHKDTIGETDLDSMDYRLTRLAPRKTRFDLSITERWMVAQFPRRSDWTERASDFWDELVAAIEHDYRAGRPAKG